MLGGEPGVGKSFLAHTLGQAVASGSRVLDRATQQGNVVYCDDENSLSDLSVYVRQAWFGLGCPSVHFLEHLKIAHFKMSMCIGDRYKILGDMIQEYKPLLTIIDTTNSALQIEDENSNSEALRAIRSLRRCMMMGPAVGTMIAIRHGRYDRDTGKRDIRGAKVWKAMADAVLFQSRARGRAKAGGWHKTYLRSLKVRAWGLKEILSLDPCFIGEGVSINTQIVQELDEE